MTKIPTHLAIIMDGNGRWATDRGQPRSYGHALGARSAKDVIAVAARRGIRYLTLFAFSSENWLRPKQEVDFLMRLIAAQIRRELDSLIKNNIRFRAIGDLNTLPGPLFEAITHATEKTKENTGMTLVFALSYGGQNEIIQAVQKIAAKIASREISPEQITSDMLSAHLESHFLPNPDLIIRTSGEHRLSNFFLWQAAYSEIYVTDKHWPEFTAKDLDLALADYSKRSRRFGGVGPSSRALQSKNTENHRLDSESHYVASDVDSANA